MDQQLLRKYLKGEASPEECIIVEEWMNGDPDAYLDALMDVTDLTELPEEEKQRIVGEIVQRAEPRRLKRWLPAAAAIITGLIGGAGYIWVAQQSKKVNIEYTVVSVPRGKTGRVTLPDGSQVYVNAGSTIRYAKNFERQSRTVILEGEAFFDVTADENRPFIIRSGGISTRVLGTSLNVSAYPNASSLTVTVITGKVSVEDTLSQKAVTLLPAQKATFVPALTTLETQTLVHPENELAWQKGELVFEETPLAEVADKLSARYGIKIILHDKQLQRYRFNGAFSKEPLEVILKMITRLTETSMKREGDTIYLSGKANHP